MKKIINNTYRTQQMLFKDLEPGQVYTAGGEPHMVVTVGNDMQRAALNLEQSHISYPPHDCPVLDVSFSTKIVCNWMYMPPSDPPVQTDRQTCPDDGSCRCSVFETHENRFMAECSKCGLQSDAMRTVGLAEADFWLKHPGERNRPN